MAAGAPLKTVRPSRPEGQPGVSPRERLVYLDLIKTFAIYLVCFYHFNDLPKDILADSSWSAYLNYGVLGLASAGVPLFFMVNGALMLNRDYNLPRHLRKILMIGVLTFVWGALTLAVLMPVKGDTYTAAEFAKALWNWKLYRINHMWFLQTLVCLYIFFPLIKEAYDKEEKGPLYFFFGTAFLLTFGNVLLSNLANLAEWVLGINHLQKNFNFFNAFNVFSGFNAYSIVYFILGGWILARLQKNRLRRPGIPALTAILLAALAVLFAYGVMMSQSNGELFDTVYDGYDTVMTLAFTVCLFLLSSRYREGRFPGMSKALQVIGSNTLGIYFVHVIVGWATVPYYQMLPFSTTLPANLVYGAAVLALSLLIVLVLKKIPVVRLLFRL